MNYFDILLAKKLEDDRDPKVEGLSVTENGRYHEDGVVYDPVIVNVPETPLSKLTVTENGTYTAPSGTAYSEVDVNVPLPENAYLLKEIEDVEIATFTDGSDLSMPKLEVAIEPRQEGSGDPSPENVRPISGWDEVDVNVSGNVNLLNPAMVNKTSNSLWKWYDTEGFRLKANTKYSLTNFTPETNIQMYIKDLATDNALVSSNNFASYTPTSDIMVYFQAYRGDGIADSSLFQLEIGDRTSYHAYNGTTITLDLDGTRYGGKVDLVSGELTVDRAYVDLGTLNWFAGYGGFIVGLNDIAPWTFNTQAPTTLICSAYPTMAYSVSTDMSLSRVASTTYIRILDSRYTAPSDFKTAMNGVQLVYELATPLTIQLSPTVVKSLRGMNNVYADCGNILDLSYLAKEE